MSPEPTSDFTDLVLHVLAHVRLDEPGCVHDPRYVAWARERTPPELASLVEHDAAVLERAWSGGGASAVAHAWPELLGSIAELGTIATQELCAIGESQVRSPAVLVRLQAAADPALELLHATLCAVAPWYAGWHAAELEPALRAACERVRPWLEQAAEVLPSLARARIELSWGLGARGRGFGARLVVGAPAAWNGLDARVPAVLAMHEQAVHDSGHAGYVHAEWAALTGLAARMRTASQALQQAHARWLASLELRPLLAELRARGWVSAEHELALHHDRPARAARLAALAEER